MIIVLIFSGLDSTLKFIVVFEMSQSKFVYFLYKRNVFRGRKSVGCWFDYCNTKDGLNKLISKAFLM